MNIIKVIEKGELEPAQVDETFLTLSREFALHKGRMQMNKFVLHVIDVTREDGFDYGLAVSTILRPLGNRTRGLQQRTTSGASLDLFVSDIRLFPVDSP